MKKKRVRHMPKQSSWFKRYGTVAIIGIIVLVAVIVTATKTADKSTVTYPQESFAAKPKCTDTFVIVTAFTDSVKPQDPSDEDTGEATKQGASCGKVKVEKIGGQSKKGAFLVNDPLEIVGSGNTYIIGDTIDKIEFTIKKGTDTVLTQEVTAKQENGGKRGKAFLNYTPNPNRHLFRHHPRPQPIARLGGVT